MLDHQKTVLIHLSDNDELFKKELHKSIDWLSQEELNDLWDWLRRNYWETHGELIVDAFIFAKAY